MIYNVYILLVIVLLYAADPVKSVAPPDQPKDASTSKAGGSGSKDKPQGKTTTAEQDRAAGIGTIREEYPVADITYQFLSNPDGYSQNVIAASSSKPYICLKKFMSPLQFSEKGGVAVIGIKGCRIDTTRRQGICYSDECGDTEIKDYYVTMNTKSSSITDISAAGAPMKSTDIYNMDSTQFFDSCAKKEISSQKGKYICRMGASITPYFINNTDAPTYSYLLPKGCIVDKATTNGACNCANPSPYRVVINILQIKEVKSLAISTTDAPISANRDPKKIFDVFRATLGNTNSYAYLPAKAWSNFWYVCFTTYDASKALYAGAEANAVQGGFIFEGCRYNSYPSKNGACPSSCTHFERMTVKIVYDETKITATSVMPGKILNLYLGDVDIFA